MRNKNCPAGNSVLHCARIQVQSMPAVPTTIARQALSAFLQGSADRCTAICKEAQSAEGCARGEDLGIFRGHSLIG